MEQSRHLHKIIENYDAIFFDLDDTLVCTEDINFILYKEIFKRFQIIIDKKGWKTVFHGRKLEDSLEKYLENIGKGGFYERIIDFFHDSADAMKLELLGKNEIVKAEFGFEVFKISKEMNKDMILCTNSRRVFADFLLSKIGIKNDFNFIICAEDIKRGKPDPEIYKTARNITGKNKRVIVVEDSVYGLMAAEKAGCDCLLINDKKFELYEVRNQPC